LKSHLKELQALFDDILTGVTRFFREPNPLKKPKNLTEKSIYDKTPFLIKSTGETKRLHLTLKKTTTKW